MSARREPAPVVGPYEHVPGAVVHRVADRMVATGGREPAVDEHDHALGQPLDLVQDVRADDDRAALRAELLEQRDEVQALDRVGAVQRLVEHEHVRIAHECGRDLRALPHALAERVDPPVGDVQHRDRAQRVLGRGAVGDAVEVGDVADELARGEPTRHRFVLGHEREPAEHVDDRDAGSLPSMRTVPWLTLMRPVIARMRVVLPGAVRSEQAGHARSERAAELRQRDLLPEPHRHVGDRHGRVGGERRIVRRRRGGIERGGHRSTQR